jgi:hypothetical protein
MPAVLGRHLWLKEVKKQERFQPKARWNDGEREREREREAFQG